MKRYSGFNFVELMLAMCILGIIITLTLPLLKNVKDDDDIYRAYMKKANQDVTDALSMALIKNRYVTDISALGKINAGISTAPYLNNAAIVPTAKGIRYLFNTALRGYECGAVSGDGNIKVSRDNKNQIKACLTNTTFDTTTLATITSGIVVSGNMTMMFDTSAQNIANGIYAHIYVDMNGNKSPNSLCKDRYRFILYNNRVALDGCSLEL